MYSKPVLYLRSAVFWVEFALSTFFWGSLIILLFFTPSDFRLRLAKLWSRTNTFSLKTICGIDYRVSGQENLDIDTPAIVMSKHQSTWETISLHSVLPLVRWVFKRELMWVPIFGWALALTDPIALDRSAGRAAINQLIKKGREKLDAGKWLIMFPEGTRTKPGKTHKYKIGGALLAEASGYPVIPVAHNSGEFWPRHSFIKWPGTIDVIIGPAIETRGRSADEINTEVSGWIEARMQEISDPARWNRK